MSRSSQTKRAPLPLSSLLRPLRGRTDSGPERQLATAHQARPGARWVSPPAGPLRGGPGPWPPAPGRTSRWRRASRRSPGDSRGTSGAPRRYAVPAAPRIGGGRKRATRLMRAAGRRAGSRRRQLVTTRREEAAPAAPDPATRPFQAAGPNQLRGGRRGRRRYRGRLPVPRCRPRAGRKGPPLGSRLPVHVDRLRHSVSGGRRPALDGVAGGADDTARRQTRLRPTGPIGAAGRAQYRGRPSSWATRAAEACRFRTAWPQAARP